MFYCKKLHFKSISTSKLAEKDTKLVMVYQLFGVKNTSNVLQKEMCISSVKKVRKNVNCQSVKMHVHTFHTPGTGPQHASDSK